MTTTLVETYPVEPLWETMGQPNTCEMARRLGIDRQVIYRWKKGGIPWHRADRIAVQLNLVPQLIWPDWS